MASHRPLKKPASKVGMPEKIFAQASPPSIDNVSLFNPTAEIDSDTVDAYLSDQFIVNRAVCLLSKAGFEILQVSPYTINIAGNQALYEKTFKTRLVAEERAILTSDGVEGAATFIECPDTDVPGLIQTDKSDLAEILEGVAIEEPRVFMAGPSPFPPNRSHWHLSVPAGVSLATNADRAHRSGITGRGVRVAMVDSGHSRHPFFLHHGYRVGPVVLGPGTSDPMEDESGHGTAASANLFAVAPDVELIPVKMSLVNSIGAFNKAVELGPDIIACGWGASVSNPPLSAANQALAVAVAAAWSAGIVVVFAAGNGHFGFPAQHPDVISAGGVFRDSNGALQASGCASGFMSNVYPNRLVPDVCGLAGQKPDSPYIVLPTAPGGGSDLGRTNGAPRRHDGTAPDDGWVGVTGTSAAASQLAGAAALIKQAGRRLPPAKVRDILKKSAIDITAGHCHASCNPPAGNPAGPGVDHATGHGLVNVNKAVLLAKLHGMIGCARALEPVSSVPADPVEDQESPSVWQSELVSLARRVAMETLSEEASKQRPVSLPGGIAWASLRGGFPLTEEDVTQIENMIIGSVRDELSSEG